MAALPKAPPLLPESTFRINYPRPDLNTPPPHVTMQTDFARFQREEEETARALRAAETEMEALEEQGSGLRAALQAEMQLAEEAKESMKLAKEEQESEHEFFESERSQAELVEAKVLTHKDRIQSYGGRLVSARNNRLDLLEREKVALTSELNLREERFETIRSEMKHFDDSLSELNQDWAVLSTEKFLLTNLWNRLQRREEDLESRYERLGAERAEAFSESEAATESLEGRAEGIQGNLAVIQEAIEHSRTDIEKLSLAIEREEDYVGTISAHLDDIRTLEAAARRSTEEATTRVRIAGTRIPGIMAEVRTIQVPLTKVADELGQCMSEHAELTAAAGILRARTQ